MARSAQRRGDAQTAAALYAAIVPSDNFYSASAAARLGTRARPHPEALAADSAALAALAARPEFVRARELLLCRLNAAALGEWLAGFGALDGAARRQAVHLASSWGWHDLAVATATREQVFFDYALLYPKPYDAAVDAAAAATKLSPTLIYALIRQESLFRPDAVSGAGAMGLAQLLPETARLTARAWSLPQPRPADLLVPDVNVRLGAAHLRSLIDRFEGQTMLALAAYNAGPVPAERWLPPEPLDADVWVENIPYNETREYVQRVLWHSVVFGWLDSGEPQNVDTWLMPILPRSASVAN
jgi:soluble lytic murein transglycosylase